MPAVPPDVPGPSASPVSDGAPGAEGDGPVSPLWPADAFEEIEAERPPRPSRGRLVAGALSILLVIALLALALPWATGASWGEIAGTFAGLPAWAVPTMALLGVLVLLLESVTVRTALPGSSWRSVLLAHPSSGALSLAVPGGSAIGMVLMGWILRRAGLALPVILTGVLAASLVEMTLTSVLVPLLGLGAYALSSLTGAVGAALPGSLWAALLAVLGAVLALALTVLVLRRGVLTALLERFSEVIPGDIGPLILHQRDLLVEMLRRRWPSLLGPTLLARVLQWAALVLAIHAVGAEIPWLLTVAIFALGRVLSLIPLTPGGAGITETVGAAALVALGVAAADAAAAMLLLMVTMLLVPLLVGGITTVLALGRTAGPHPSAR